MSRQTVTSESNGTYVQYGCGVCAPEGWKNFDGSPTLRLQRLPLIGRAFSSRLFAARGVVVFPGNVAYGDITKGLPISPGSCDAIYCSHVLEHLTLDEFRLAIKNSYAYLKSGGMFRLVLPDLKRMAQQYVSSSQSDAAHVFMESSCLGKKSRARGFEGLLRSWLGSGAHLWMWDYEAMRAELAQAGFVGIRTAEFGDSTEGRFREVEQRERWENCLGVEAVKGTDANPDLRTGPQ